MARAINAMYENGVFKPLEKVRLKNKQEVKLTVIDMSRGCAKLPGYAVYVGDLYSIDVVGARAAGMTAILMDPGACWGARDCPSVPTALAAVQHVLYSGNVT